jgi:hypothetical protein
MPHPVRTSFYFPSQQVSFLIIRTSSGGLVNGKESLSQTGDERSKQVPSLSVALNGSQENEGRGVQNRDAIQVRSDESLWNCPWGAIASLAYSL